MKTTMKYLAVLLLLGSPSLSWSQEDDAELNIIEVELERARPSTPDYDRSDLPSTSKDAGGNAADAKPIDFQGLGKLAPFSEVSVIQKRYMPKTGRFQLFGGATLITNDPFFNTFGLVGKASYFFTEGFGLELNYFALTTSEATSTTSLKKIQGVRTDNLIITKNVAALDVMWVPIYGKMAWFNRRIVPFDLYFSAGYGSTGLGNGSAGTLHLATGQIFAASKSTAFRWDFSWNFFKAVGVDRKEAAYNNLFLTAGWSWFFPEAKYR